MVLSEEAELHLHEINPKEWRAVRLFWIGLAIYTAGYAFSKGMPASLNRWFVVQALGLLLCLPASITLIRFRIESKYLKTLFYLYCGWLAVIVFRGISFKYVEMRSMAFDLEYGVFVYFVPLVMLFPKNVYYLKRVFEGILILGLLYLVFCALFRGQLRNPDPDNLESMGFVEVFNKSMCIPSGFILLTYVYHSNSRRILAGLVTVVGLVLAIIRARRGLLLISFSTLFATYLIYFYLNRKKISAIFVSAALILAMGAYVYKTVNSKNKGIFGTITERADEDTRSGVEKCYYEDMKSNDWIIGRGMNGEYFCPGVETDYSVFRRVIETDYLNIILKGGFLSLGLLLLIVVPAMVMALFDSKNMLSRAFGIWMLLWLLELYPTTVFTFSGNHILVWIGVGFCYSKAFRHLSEDDVRKILAT